METNETQQRFIELCAQGWSYARIAQELGVHINTLVNWSRKLQFQIQNAKTMADEALALQYFAVREDRWKLLSDTLHRVNTELAQRDLSTLPTGRLFNVAAALRREVQRETALPGFTLPVSEIPAEELQTEVQDWKP